MVVNHSLVCGSERERERVTERVKREGARGREREGVREEEGGVKARTATLHTQWLYVYMYIAIITTREYMDKPWLPWRVIVAMVSDCYYGCTPTSLYAVNTVDDNKWLPRMG